MHEKYKELREYCAAYKHLVDTAVNAIKVEADIFSLNHDMLTTQAYEHAATDILTALSLIYAESEVYECVDV